MTYIKKIEIKTDNVFVKIPKHGAKYAVAYDIVAPDDLHVRAHARQAFDMKFAINLPPHIEAKIEPRSGHSLRGMIGEKKPIYSYINILGFKICTAVEERDRFDADVIVGKIDCGYRDNIHVTIKNNDVDFTIPKGTRIAQMTFYRFLDVDFDRVEKFTLGYNRGGGHGSTGC